MDTHNIYFYGEIRKSIHPIRLLNKSYARYNVISASFWEYSTVPFGYSCPTAPNSVVVHSVGKGNVFVSRHC